MPEIRQHAADAIIYRPPPSHPLVLGDLTIREEIADGLARCILSLDTADPTLWKTSIHNSPDTSFMIAGQLSLTGYEALTAYFTGTIFPLTTLHQVSNVRVDSVDQYRGVARISASAVVTYYRPEDAFEEGREGYVMGCLYDVEVVRDGPKGHQPGTLWKVRAWVVQPLWTQGDRGVVFGREGSEVRAEKGEKM